MSAPSAPARKRNLALALTLGGITLFALLAAAMAGTYARRLYLQRAQLLLEPTNEAVFALENAGLPPATSPRVVMFGDSRIAGWDPKPAAQGHELVWRGVRGESTAQMRHRYDSDTRGIGASIVVLQAGINDLAAGVATGQPSQALDRAFANLSWMVDSSTLAGIEVIVMTVVPPASPPVWRRVVWSEDIYGLVDQLNTKLKGLSGPAVRIIDAENVLCGDSDRVPARLARDTMHLRAGAYELLNRALTDELLEYTVALQ